MNADNIIKRQAFRLIKSGTWFPLLNDKNKMYLESANIDSTLDDSKHFLSCTNDAILTEYSIF